MANLMRLLGQKPFAEAMRTLRSRRLFVKESKLHPDLYLVKYDLRSSNFRDRVTSECRGIILQKDTNRIIAYAFDKFWNYNEENAAQIDWSTARVYEKVDGALMKVFWYKDEWIVASNNTIDAREAMFPHIGISMRTMFDQAAPAGGFPFDALDSANTYMFELVHPQLESVVKHEVPKLYHIGTRRVCTAAKGGAADVGSDESISSSSRSGVWISPWPEIAVEVPNVQPPPSFPLTSIDDCTAAAEALLNPQEAEGFVVTDAFFRRLKVKSRSYVAAAAMGVMGSKGRAGQILRAWLMGEMEELSAYYPDCKYGFDAIEGAFREAVIVLLDMCEQIAQGQERKTVASLARRERKQKLFNVIMSMYDAGLHDKVAALRHEDGEDVTSSNDERGNELVAEWFRAVLQDTATDKALEMLGLKPADLDPPRSKRMAAVE